MLDLAMIVLSRSKNAAVRAGHGPIVGGRRRSHRSNASCTSATRRPQASPWATVRRGPQAAASSGRRGGGVREPRPMTDQGAALLLVSDDEVLLEELQRLAAGAGVVPEVARREAAALRAWAGPRWSWWVRTWPTDGRAAPSAAGRRARGGSGAVRGRLFRRRASSWGPSRVPELGAAGDWLGQLFSELGDRRPPGRVLAVMRRLRRRGGHDLRVCPGPGRGRPRTGAAGRRGPPRALARTACWGSTACTGCGGTPWPARPAGSAARSLRDALPRRGAARGPHLGRAARCRTRGRARSGRPSSAAPPGPRPGRGRPAAARRRRQSSELLTRCDQLLVVVRPTLTGVAAATRQVAALEGRGLLVVRGRGLSPETVAGPWGPRCWPRCPTSAASRSPSTWAWGRCACGRGALGRAAARLLSSVDRGWAA